MFRPSIRRKIVGIALGLIVLMAITSVLSIVMSRSVSHLLDELTAKYVPAYASLARANVRSLERGLALRRMIIAKMQTPPDNAAYADQLKVFHQKTEELTQEANAARQLINGIIEESPSSSNTAALARLETRIESATGDLLNRMDEQVGEMLAQIGAANFVGARQTMVLVDAQRDEFNQKLDAIRRDMLAQVGVSAAKVMGDEQRAILISAAVTVLAAVLGLVFALLVSSGITRPVRRLLESTREVETGRLDRSIDVTTSDEIGQLSTAFNRMVEKLRRNERVRETFGKYIDPKIVEGLIEQPALTATEGQHRIMTVMFCDVKGFTSLSEGMTPQGLVKVINRYLSTMSEPIRAHRGIIDKYIGDAIMAYWGPPFIEEAEQTTLACLAALDMVEHIPTLRKEIPQLLGVRHLPLDFDIRIGIATGEALVGSIGSAFMMNYTVMGDTVNLSSRLEAANKIYGTRIMATEETIAPARAALELRELDRLVVVGQSRPQVVYEIVAPRGKLAPKLVPVLSRYAEGLAAYRAQRWDEAAAAFQAALQAGPDDGPSRTLAERVEALRRNPPPADWDGAWHLDHK